MLADDKSVPVLMFHSVGLEHYPWVWSYISESIESFEQKIILFKEAGFHAIHWRDLYDYMAGRRQLPRNSILLTFDDGYLDNWVYVYPLLKKHGMRGTIFVSPDFVDPAIHPRPNLDDVVAGRRKAGSLQAAGFLSWAEMREMERSGVIDIQSHAMTHTWYFSGPRVIDFHRPHSVVPHPWLFWNARPDRKPFYLGEDQQDVLPWGYPILEHRKSLEVRRYFPDPAAIDRVCSFVADYGGRDFFGQPEALTKLRKKLTEWFDRGEVPGRYETEEARLGRLDDELRTSKALIEKNLGKTVDYICWPGGANDRSVQDLAASIGYKAWTLSSTSELAKRNVPGADPRSIKRIGTSNSIEIRGRLHGTAGPRYQLWRVLEHQGSSLHSALLKGYKLSAMARAAYRKPTAVPPVTAT